MSAKNRPYLYSKLLLHINLICIFGRIPIVLLNFYIVIVNILIILLSVLTFDFCWSYHWLSGYSSALRSSISILQTFFFYSWFVNTIPLRVQLFVNTVEVLCKMM